MSTRIDADALREAAGEAGCLAVLRSLGIDTGAGSRSGDNLGGLRLPPTIAADRRPSLSVNVRDWTCNDFGGHFQGTVFQLVQEAFGDSFPEAVDRVARTTGYTNLNATMRDKPLTLEALAEQKRLPVSLLEAEGWRQSGRFVRIPYFLADGTEARPQLRRADGGQFWGTRGAEASMPIVPLGLHRLGGTDEVALVEGATDWLTLRHHGIPALGIPGASMTGKLEVEHLAGVRRVYVVKEDDAGGGATFARNATARLREIGFAGEVLVVDMKRSGSKDPSALHVADPEAFRERWEALVATAAPYQEDPQPKGPEEEDESRGRESAASCIVRLVEERGAELWHNADEAPFITFENAGHRETHPLRQKAARRWLAKLYYDDRGRAPGSQAVEDATSVLEGRALYDGPEYRTAVRVAEVENEADPVVYLDLGTETWEVIEVRPGHWGVIPAEACPVRFERRGGMLPLPMPERGGNARALADLLNVNPDSPDLILTLSWLCQALRGTGPYPVLEVTGEQGSGKSTSARMLRSLLDPNAAPLRSLPRSDHEAFISATNAQVLAFDNVSGFRADVSDRMCRISTGGGFSVRQLYTSDAETIFNSSRPQIINGIEDLATQPDLADRTITLRLPRIGEGERRTEADLWGAFEEARPSILGGLLDVVAAGLSRLPSVQLDALPRMADFALWATACEVPLGYESGTFLRAYEEGRTALIEATVEGEPVAEAVQLLASRAGSHDVFEGTASELLDALTDAMGYGYAKDDKRRPPREWPKNARSLSGRLRRLAPSLRALGTALDFDKQGRGKNRARVITIQKDAPDLRPHRPHRPPPGEERPRTNGKADLSGDAKSDRTDSFASPPAPFASPPGTLASPRNGSSGSESHTGDGGDGGDAKSHPTSEQEEPWDAEDLFTTEAPF